jgi:hypothetical protein
MTQKMTRKKLNVAEHESNPNGAAGKMNDALLEQANQTRDRIAKIENNDVMGRYAVACDFHTTRDAAKYGANAMQKFAKFVGWSLTTVQDYAKLAATWPDAQKFAKLAAKQNKNGIPLSWSHFVALMREEDAELRADLMAQALKKGWTVAELEAGRKTPTSGPSDNTGTATTDSTAGTAEPVAANPVIAMVSGVAEKLTAVKATCETDLLKTIAAAPAATLDETLTSLQTAREQVVTLHKSTLNSIDVAIAQVEERRKLEAKKKGKPAGKTDKASASKANPSKKSAA